VIDMLDLIKSVFIQYKKVVHQDDTTSLAYHLILSLIPTITALFLLIRLFQFKEEYIFSILELYVTDELFQTIKALIDVSVKKSYLDIAYAFAIGSSLWSSSKGMYTIRKIANLFYGVEATSKNMVKERLISLGYMLLFVIMMLCILFLFGIIPVIEFMASSKNKYQLLRILLLFLIAFLVLLVLNGFIPSVSLKLEDVMIGSFVSALVFTICVLGFIFILQIWDYRSVYGPLSLIIIALMWLNTVSMIIYIGFCINAVCYEKKRIAKLNIKYDEDKQVYARIE